MKITSTRLRYIRVNSADELTKVIEGLGFKVEIKGGPILEPGGTFLLFFVPPENPEIKVKNIDLS